MMTPILPSTLSPEQTILLHEALMRVLDRNNTRFGLGAQALAMLIVEFGFTLPAADTERALDYLSDSAIGYTELLNKGEFNPAARTWKLTAKGTNYLREHGY